MYASKGSKNKSSIDLHFLENAINEFNFRAKQETTENVLFTENGLGITFESKINYLVCYG